MTKKCLLFAIFLLVLSLFSCSSSKSQNDSDILPDSDSDNTETIADDDTDEEDSDFIDDSDEKPDHDADSATPEEPDGEIFEETEPINGYARCYDKIPAGDYEGFFADKKIESQIKTSLGYDSDYELSEEDFENIKSLVVCVQDLRGIEKLINLETITISGGNVYDFSPLLKLKNLKNLIIDAEEAVFCSGGFFPGISQVTPKDSLSENITCLDGSFSLLTNLETVKISNTILKDISPVEQLVNLISLTTYYNDIELLPKNIGNLQRLEEFIFSFNNVKDITPVKSLKNLKKLMFDYNDVEDISPIKDLINLNILYCNSNRISDISPITSLINLIYLGLNQNQIEEIPKEITNLKKLKDLDLSLNNISNLPELKGLDSVEVILLTNNFLNEETIMKLGELENLKFLRLSYNKFTKIPVMRNLKSLTTLYMSSNTITDLAGFADNESFPALENLYLDSNKINNVEVLRHREGLMKLFIGKNCIEDLSPLEELKENGTYISGMNEQLESCER